MQHKRLRLLSILYLVAFAAVLGRLFYWQILSRERLQALAQSQHESTVRLAADRGLILAADGYPLVGNQPAYLVYAYMPDIEVATSTISQALAPIVADTPEQILATPSAELQQTLVELMEATLSARLANSTSSWIPLKRQINQQQKEQVEALGIHGIGFDQYQVRMYPESSMSAQLLGFVGSDGTGNPKGYSGLEGFYNLELTGRSGLIQQEKDALGRPIVIGEFSDIKTRNGRNLVTHIDRSLQLLAESRLKEGIEKYGAASGEIVIMKPDTGAIMALASEPSYDPDLYKLYDTDLYKIPAIANTFEPGSIFKPLVMASAINEGLITPESTCDADCAGPRKIGNYSIRTWNNEYSPGETMMQVLERSDNTGMVHVSFLMGEETFVKYLKAFGFGAETGIDLEAEAPTYLRKEWGDIDLATASFGQGLAVTSMQMLTAINALANEGNMMQPQVVDKVIQDGEELDIEPKLIRQVVSKETADTMKQMLIASAEHGDAKWAIPDGYLIAGKTGTAQVPIAGHYDPNKTVASFIGFAPANDPQFTMIVRLNQPSTSIWASETAAPLWFELTRDLFVHMGIEPSE